MRIIILTKNGINTYFRPQENPLKHFNEEQKLKILSKNLFEEWFWKGKRALSPLKNKDSSKETKILSLFFGIHTANAYRDGKK